MADLKAAADFLLPLEDATMSGEVVNLGDGAGLTRFGLTAKWHPELIKLGFFDAVRTPVSAAIPMADEAFSEEYGPGLGIAALDSQAVANVLMDFAVNEYIPEAVTLAQQAAVSLGQHIAVDGQCGPATVAALNACDPASLVNAICDRQAAWYEQLAQRNPAKAQFLNGWLNRVKLTRARALEVE